MLSDSLSYTRHAYCPIIIIHKHGKFIVCVTLLQQIGLDSKDNTSLLVELLAEMDRSTSTSYYKAYLDPHLRTLLL